MVEFCREHGIAHNVCGKVIVATHADELPRLEELRKRGEANGLTGLRLIGPEELREIEPHATGLQALVVPSTGITDYARVCEKYAELISAGGGTVLTSAAATGIRRMASEIVVETSKGAFSTTSLINCAGLFSDRISRMAGDDPGVMIVPFRGEYYDLIPERASLVRALIYPVPDPRFPFLGVHFTRRITGRVDAGPNAVLALAREGYRHTRHQPARPGVRSRLPRLLAHGRASTGATLWTNGTARFRSQPSCARCSACFQKWARKIWFRAAPACALRLSSPTALWSTIFNSCRPARCCTCSTFPRRRPRPRSASARPLWTRRRRSLGLS